MLTEDGLYELLMQSRKPIAKQFKKEVKRILKELRKIHRDVSKMLNTVDEGEKLKRTLYVSGQGREMWFLTEDIADWIEHKQVSRMMENVDEDEKIKMCF